MNKCKILLISSAVIVLCFTMSACFIPGVTLNGRFTEEIDLSFAAAGISVIDADTTNGSITVNASDTQEIKVHAEKTIRALTDEKAKEYAAEVELFAETEGDMLKVYYEHPKGWKQVQVNIQYTIDCPPSIALRLGTTNGNIEVMGVNKAVEANTTNGNIGLTGGEGTIILRTTNGNVDIEDSKGRIETSTTNGNIHARIETLEDKADLSTTNGGVHVEIQKGTAPVRASSTNGAITIGLPSDFNGQLDASTFNGSVSSDFAIPVQKPSKRSLKGPIGEGGDCEIYARTTNGGISIKKIGTP